MAAVPSKHSLAVHTGATKAKQQLPGHALLQQAATWFATLGDEAVTAQQRADWQHWHDEDAQHRLAWQFVETVGQRFQQASRLGEPGEVSNTLDTVRSDRISRRKALRGLGGLGAICVSGYLGWRFTPVVNIAKEQTLAWRADHHTATGESRKITLPDGGQLWLNTASAINTQYRAERRQIKLLSGEILIETARDLQQRPFLVTTAQGFVQAIGTRFTVRELKGATFLAVYQGAVKIHTHSGQGLLIEAGQQTTFSQDRIQPPTRADHAREAWAQHLVVANNISLASLVAELNRYQYGHLAVAPAVAELRVMGTYPADQPELALAMLEKALPIKVNRLLPWWVTLELP